MSNSRPIPKDDSPKLENSSCISVSLSQLFFNLFALARATATPITITQEELAVVRHNKVPSR